MLLRYRYVDGREYFSAVAKAIEGAREEILIADWWLSPEMYLQKPPFTNEEMRLDKVLARKAEQGVKACTWTWTGSCRDADQSK
jgi:phospholipase D1/2